MKKVVTAAVLASAALFPTAVSAQSQQGFYGGFSGGGNFVEDSDLDVLGSVNVDNEYETGWAISGALGYDYGKVWRFGGLRSEIELSYRENDIDTHRVAALGGDQPGSTGEVSTFAIMLNGMHDFDTGTAFTPYVGGGIGYAWNDLSDYGIAAIPNVLDDDDSGFAWQLIAGVGYAFTPRATVTLDYRYFSTEADVTSSAATGRTSSDVELDSHTIMLGLRYQF